MTTAYVTPRTGPCAPWLDAQTVLTNPRVADAASEKHLTTESLLVYVAQAVDAASGIMYGLSGRQFSGECEEVTVRPFARPVDQDSRTFGLGISPFGWFSGWGTCVSGYQGAAVGQHYGCTQPPVVELGAYPVTEILSVYIDGTLIPANEYKLDDYQRLIRMRVNAETPPTERWGWPTCQILDLPLTEVGTFGITYTYGEAPPVAGVLACTEMAIELALALIGSPNRLPARVTTMTRQGMTMAVVDVMDFFSKNLTGLYQVDLWLRTVNPGGARRQPLVWSPDIGRPARDPRS